MTPPFISSGTYLNTLLSLMVEYINHLEDRTIHLEDRVIELESFLDLEDDEDD